MKAEYIQYKYMTDKVRDFCGSHNLVTEAQQFSGCIGYFLTPNNHSTFTMLVNDIYIIKDSIGNIQLDYKEPVGLLPNYICKPADSTHKDKYFNYFYKQTEDSIYIWTGYEWEQCSTFSLQRTTLVPLSA